MTGKMLQDAIAELARRLGYKVAHFHTSQVSKGAWATPAKYDAKGFPDLILARPRPNNSMAPARLLFVEVKGDRDRLRPEQHDWLDWLRGCTGGERDHVRVDVRVWTPLEWESGAIERALR